MSLDYKSGVEWVRKLLSEAGDDVSPLEKIAIEAAWEDVTYASLSDFYGVSYTTLQNHVAPALWKKLSNELGQKVGKKNLKSTALTSMRRSLHSPTQLPFECPLPITLPYTKNFVGREKELVDLRKLACKFPLTLLFGMEGVGKKSLVSKMLRSQGQHFPSKRLIWKSLHHSPDVETFESELTHAIDGGEQETLFRKLEKGSHLIILDSLDSVFSRYQGDKEKGYFCLLRRIVEETHTTIIAISNRPVEQVEPLILRGRAISYLLTGVTVDEARLILCDRLRDYAEEICKAVGGNPFLLQKLAGNADYIDPESLHRLTVQYGLVGSFYEQLLRGANLTTLERSLLLSLSKQSQGIVLSDLLAKYPSAGMNIKYLIDMGVAMKTRQGSIDSIMVSPLLRRTTTALGY